jgi:hypothetical protein
VTPCPNCGSSNQSVSVGLSDELTIRESWRFKFRDGTLPSKDKLRRDTFIGSELRKSLGDFVHKERTIDRDANRYHELVREESGEITHQVDEPLSDHSGHGSAKLKPAKSDPDKRSGDN